jgi:3-deoxy-D-manno-octulosonic-acid transferase
MPENSQRITNPAASISPGEFAARVVYNILIYLLSPPFALYWCWRYVRNPAYRDRVMQRIGFQYPQTKEGSIWLHAVSVGEVQAAIPLIRRLLHDHPSRRVVISTVTPTGAERVRALFGQQVEHCYLPYDSLGAVRRFFDAVKPDIALIMETEIWPNLYHECGKRAITLLLVSARISPKSVRSYRRMLPLIRRTLSHGIFIAAQTETDAQRFISVGAVPDRTRVTGNIKFDIEPDADLPNRGRAMRRDVLGDRLIWVAASTHPGEDEIVLSAHERLLERIPGALLVLVPRHPDRFTAVESLVRARGFSCVTRTDGKSCSPATQVFLGNTMGELNTFYAASDIAFVAGSLVPVGGHNLIEPAVLGLPILTGPHVFNSQDIADLFIEEGAAVVVNNVDELAEQLARLGEDAEARRTAGHKGLEILDANRGALGRLFDLLAPLIGEPESGRRPAE